MFLENYYGMYQWGLDFIRAVQSAETPLTLALLKAVTMLGDPYVVVFIALVLFWCIDSKKGLQVCLTVMLSFGVNTLIKQALKVPRPFELDPAVWRIAESGFSTPSGHAQISATLWPLLCVLLVRKPKRARDGSSPLTADAPMIGGCWRVVCIAGAVLLPLLIGFSRPALGVHYPSDIIFGWALGLAFAALSAFVWPLCQGLWQKLPHSPKILLCAAPAFAMLALNNAEHQMPALFFATAVGAVYQNERGGFNAREGTFTQKLLRLALGGVLAGLYMLVFKSPQKSWQFYNYVHFAKYAVLGFYFSFVAPQFFCKLRLAQPANAEGGRAAKRGGSAPGASVDADASAPSDYAQGSEDSANAQDASVPDSANAKGKTYD